MSHTRVPQEHARVARIERETASARAAHAAACAELTALRRADFLNERMRARRGDDGDSDNNGDRENRSACANASASTLPPNHLALPLSEELRKAARFGAPEVNDLFKQQYMALLAEVSDGQSGWYADG